MCDMKKLFLVMILLPILAYGGDVVYTDHEIKSLFRNVGYDLDAIWHDTRMDIFNQSDELIILNYATGTQTVDPGIKDRFNNFFATLNNKIKSAPVPNHLKNAVLNHFSEDAFNLRVERKDPYILDCPSVSVIAVGGDDTDQEKSQLLTSPTTLFRPNFFTTPGGNEEEKARFSEEQYLKENPPIHHRHTLLPTKEDIENYVKEHKTHFIANSGVVLADVVLGAWIEKNIKAPLPIYLPLFAPWVFSSVLTLPSTFAYMATKEYVGKTVALTLTAPIVEEFLFRYLLQKVILNELPRTILDKLAPEYSKYVDTYTAKGVRIALTATLFGLAQNSLFTFASHLFSHHYFSMPTGFAQILSGVAYGILLETATDTKWGVGSSIVAHIIHNSIWVYLFGSRSLTIESVTILQ